VDDVQVGSRSETGHVRRRNEDSCLVAEGAGVFVVADGLGGHPAGDVASAVAGRRLGEVLTADVVGDAAEDGSGPRDLLLRALGEAHAAIEHEAGRDPELTGMATTAVVALVRGGHAWVAHVGDSRAYLLRRGTAPEQVTADHGMGGYLTQALGLPGGITPDVTELVLEDGTWLLLCTDGLTNMLDDATIARLVEEAGDAQAGCDALVDAALAAGGVDNVTVVLLRG
jgi:protein phosphatase